MSYPEKKIKVLLLSRWYPHRKDPMLGLFVQRHAEAIAQLCEVFVLYVQEDENIKDNIFETDQFCLNNVSTIIVYYKKKAKASIFAKGFNIINYFKAYKKGWKMLKKQNINPDIIHANILTRTGIVALYLKIFKNIPFVITEHWSRYLNNSISYKGYFRKLFTRIIVRKAAAITTVTKNLMEAMQKHHLLNNSYYVIPNVVDVDKFFPKQNVGKNLKKRIIHISCFEDISKNISGIMRSVEKLSHIRQDFEIRFVGDGLDKKKLEKFAKTLGIKDTCVFFDGLMEGQHLVDYLNTADFLILFSNYENLPVVILEAFACGLPVLSTDVGGISEYLIEERGVLTKAGDESAFVEKLDYMLSSYSNFNKEKIREFALNNFSNKVIGESFYNIYKDILFSQKK